VAVGEREFSDGDPGDIEVGVAVVDGDFYRVVVVISSI